MVLTKLGTDAWSGYTDACADAVDRVANPLVALVCSQSQKVA